MIKWHLATTGIKVAQQACSGILRPSLSDSVTQFIVWSLWPTYLHFEYVPNWEWFMRASRKPQVFAEVRSDVPPTFYSSHGSSAHARSDDWLDQNVQRERSRQPSIIRCVCTLVFEMQGSILHVPESLLMQKCQHKTAKQPFMKGRVGFFVL